MPLTSPFCLTIVHYIGERPPKIVPPNLDKRAYPSIDGELFNRQVLRRATELLGEQYLHTAVLRLTHVVTGLYTQFTLTERLHLDHFSRHAQTDQCSRNRARPTLG